VIYRREIDGLRAIAIIPVILFHAGFVSFDGGFVGVDIFFVISGYLITSIILSDLSKGTFSLTTFYERRARRILPPLFFVLLCCLPFSWFWLLPHHLKDFAQSLAGVAGLLSNIVFWKESGYFETSAELKPLLHTWSLSVEEQFYTLFPLLLMFFWRIRKRWIFGVLVILTFMSLIIAQWGAYFKPTATFYLLPTRAWELSIGAIIAFLSIYKSEHFELITSNKCINEVFSCLGLTLILYSISVFDKYTPFPSFYALTPTIGTALIIVFSTSDNLSGRFLSTKFMVGIGLISYSTYLWHQPVFSFARHRSLTELNFSLIIALSTLSIVLGYLSWKYIETPFRNNKVVSRRKIFSLAIIGSLAFASIGLYTSENIQLTDRESTGGNCNVQQKNCYFLEKSKFEVALWGDSYADAFSKSLGKVLNSNDLSLNLYIMHSCPSIISSLSNENRRLKKGFSAACYEHNHYSYNDIIKRQPKYVVIANAYEHYLNDRNLSGEHILVDLDDRTMSPKLFIPARIKEMVQKFKDNNIVPIIVTPHPLVKNFFEQRKKYKFGVSSDILAELINAKDARDIILSELSELDSFYRELEGIKLFCDENNYRCSVVDENKKLLLFDGSHISTTLAKKVAEHVQSIIMINER